MTPTAAAKAVPNLSVRPIGNLISPHQAECLAGCALHPDAPEAFMEKNGQDFSSGWNFGPGQEAAIKVVSIARKLSELCGSNARYVIAEEEHPHETSFLKLDCSKARTRLGWRPQLDIDSALALTVEWHKATHTGVSMRDMTLKQIAFFKASIPNRF